MSEEDEDKIPAELLDAVDQQLASAQTVYVSRTLERLTKSGLSETDAKAQIALVLGETMDDMIRSRRGFDEDAYRAALKELPMQTDG